MNKDIDEIIKIVSLFDKEATYEQTKKILLRIGEITRDEYRKDKYEQISKHLENLIEQTSAHFGIIQEKCCIDLCEDCVINKWCNHYRNIMQESANDREEITFADFFCGAGGLSLGFSMNNFKMSLANDIEDCCIDTIALNHPETPGQHIIAGDINDVLNDLQNKSRFDRVDVVIGGPPCQGFSMANRQRIIDDPRNHLYKSFVTAISILNPKFFVMENVRGMLGVATQIKEDFADIGYSSSVHLLNAKDFGIPQNRERVIFIGNRIGIDNEAVFEEIFNSSHNKRKTLLQDAIENLPELKAKTIKNASHIEDSNSGYTFSLISGGIAQNSYVDEINSGKESSILYNHKARYNNERDIKIFGLLNPGDNSADPKIADIMPYKRREKIFKDKYFKLELDKPCKTITAHMKYDCNMYIHPTQARGLTPREAARVQSYPDWYYFRGPYTKTFMQVGNSVPPMLSKTIAAVIRRYIVEDNNGSI